MTPQPSQWTGTWFEEPDANDTVDDNQVKIIMKKNVLFLFFILIVPEFQSASKNNGQVISVSVDTRSKATQTKGTPASLCAWLRSLIEHLKSLMLNHLQVALCRLSLSPAEGTSSTGT